MEQNNNSLATPIAIVIAGAVIAGAVIFTGGDYSNSKPNNNNGGSGNVITQKSDKEIKELVALRKDEHILGDRDSEILIIEFSDTECPFCKSFHSTMHKIIDEFGDGRVAWAYRHFPLEGLHRKAKKEAIATECANELGGNDVFWTYVDEIYNVTPSNDGLDEAQLPQIAEDVGLDKTLFEECLNSGKYTKKIEDDIKNSRDLGGTGTPFSVMVLKEKISDEDREFIKANYPATNVSVSSNGEIVYLRGALQYEMVKPIIQAIIEG
jgi:predicted DsbA family dithiol-disulfide isomerase